MGVDEIKRAKIDVKRSYAILVTFVYKGRILENMRKKGEYETWSFRRRVGGVVGTCSGKP